MSQVLDLLLWEIAIYVGPLKREKLFLKKVFFKQR